MCVLRRFALSTVMLVLLCNAPGVRAQLTLSDISFEQLDWYRQDASLAQANSLYGRMDYSYTPVSSTSYLNVTFNSPSTGSPVWAIQNVPLFGVDNNAYSRRTESVFLNLGELGLSAGQKWSNASYVLSVSAGVMATAPMNAATLAAVSTLKELPTDSINEAPVPGPFTDPGAPQGSHLTAAATKTNATHDVRAVQEAKAFCFAGSTARSLDWIMRTNEFGVSKDGQGIYQDLVDLKVSAPNADGSRARERWITAKDKYARQISGNRIETKAWDSGTSLDPTKLPGIERDTNDLAEWLQGEIAANEDVELAYFYPGNAHIITLVDVYTADGMLYADYRDDETQGDDTKGDTSVKKGVKIYKDAKGAYHFGSDSNTIYFALSESAVPEPGAFVTLGLGTCVLAGWVRRRKRR